MKDRHDLAGFLACKSAYNVPDGRPDGGKGGVDLQK